MAEVDDGRTWTMDVLYRDGEWKTVERRYTADTLKAWAREWYRVSLKTGVMAARIFDPLGRLAYVADFERCHSRVRWMAGSFLTRAQLAERQRIITMSLEEVAHG